MSSPICLDASVLLKLYLPEENADEAEMLVSKALGSESGIVGPSFLLAEVLSALRREVYQGKMATSEGDEAVDLVLDMAIEEVAGPDLYHRAWQIADELGMPVIYDAVYLAVAELRGATFWTANRKLYDRAKGKQYVRLLGEPA